jgi:CDGSH-type Zn-finger protein
MACSCGFSTEYPMCNGTHKIVKSVKDKIIEAVEAIEIESSITNALGMKLMVIDVIKKTKGI